MANDFVIRISAVDKATAVVRRINDQVSRFTRPITEVKRSVIALNRELGLDRMGKGLVGVARSASDVAEKMSRIVAPLTAIVGVSSVAAVVELAKKWGDFGAEISRTSLTLGVSANDLQGLRGAAQLAGVPVDALTGGLETLGNTMQAAFAGRNQEALMLLNKLRISIKRNADGAIDTVAAFKDMSAAIAGFNGQPQLQSVIARAFGLEAVLPLLRQGPKAIDAYIRKVAEMGGIMSGPAIAAAKAYYESMTTLDMVLNNVRNTIGSALLPILQPFIDKIAAWTVANKDLIATKFAEVAKGIADAVASIDWNAVVEGAKSFVQGIRDVVDWIGGWKVAIVGLLILMNGALIGSLINLGIALGKLAFWGIPVLVRAFGGLAMVTLPGLFLKLGLLTETILPALSGAFVAFGAVLETTPIGWIITAIAGIGFAGYELVKHWDDIKRWWHRLWGDMSDDASKGANDINSAQQRASKYSGYRARGQTQAAPETGLPGQQRVTKRGGYRAPAEASIAPGTDLLGLVRRLENSGDNAVSRAGAIGRNQIMPGTAVQYGFNPARLTDPAYNDMVATAILGDLQKRYGGDTDAILAAYNGGPGRANQFLAAGRNANVLPAETQAYLSRSHLLLGQPGPAVATPYTAANPTPAIAQAPQAGGAGMVTVEISFANAPPGMQSRLRTAGPVIANTRINYTMPEVAQP